MDSEIQREDILRTVTFHNTEDIYPPSTDLICWWYTSQCKELDNYGTNFWIAIFKVGWETTEEFLVKASFDKTAITSVNDVGIQEDLFEILFAAEEIPESNDDEFYQFCFLTEKGCVLGASCPFQIKEEAVLLSRPSSLIDSDLDEQAKNELEWCPWFEVSGEEVDGAVLVHNKTTMLEKSLANMSEENNILRDYKDKLELEIKDLGEQMLEIQQQKGTVERLLLEKRRQEVSDMNQLDELQEKLEQKSQIEKLLEGELSQLKKHVQMLQNQCENNQSEIENLDALLKRERGQERDNLLREFEKKLQLSETALQDVKELLGFEKESNKSLAVKHESELEHAKQCMEKLIMDLAEKQDCVYYLEENKSKIMHDLKREQENLVLLKLEYENIIEAKESKIGELQEANDLLCDSSDQKILDLQMGIKSKANKIEKLTKEQEEQIECYNAGKKILEKQLEKLKQTADNQETENYLLHKKNQILENENVAIKEKATGDNGSRHALQVAYFHTQKQMSQLKIENEQLQQHCQDLKQKVPPNESEGKAGDLQKQVEDLKLRLCMGANAYKEKFLECKRLQSEVRKLKKSTPSVDKSISVGICDASANKGPSSPKLTEDVETLRSRLKLVQAELNKDKNCVKENSNVSTDPDLVKVQDELKSNFKKNEKLKEQLDKTKKDHEKVVFALTSEIKKLEEVVSEKEQIMGKLKKAEEGFKRDQKMQEHAEGMVRERLEGLREENVHLKEENVEMRRKLEEAKNTAPSEVAQNHQHVISTQPQAVQLSQQGFPARQDQEPFKIFRPPQLYEESFGNTIEKPLHPSVPCPVPPVSKPQKIDVSNRCVQDGVNQHQPELIPHIKNRRERKKASSDGKERLAQRGIPVTICPICDMEFPPGSSELSASQHINGHFSN